jgi:hypothetical protein
MRPWPSGVRLFLLPHSLGFRFPPWGGVRGREAEPLPCAVAMWPPDPDPEPEPEPAGGSRAGAAVPALRALLPARAFLCSLKGRLLLAESVSARGPCDRAAPCQSPRRMGWGAVSRSDPPSRRPARQSP